MTQKQKEEMDTEFDDEKQDESISDADIITSKQEDDKSETSATKISSSLLK